MDNSKRKHNWLDIANAILLPVVLAAVIVSLTISAKNSAQLGKIINNHTDTLQTIKSNQQNNSNALEVFFRNGIACIFTAPPAISTQGNQAIKVYVDNCFADTPPVK